MKKFVNRIYAFVFFEDLVLIYPLYAVLFTDSGMEPWQVGTLLTVWSVTTLILEVPSGVLADQYSRKWLLFIGQFIRSFAYLIWWLYPSFWGFLIGFVLWGIESALSSGTFEALVYDELKHFGKEKEYVRIIGKADAISSIAILIAALLASPAILLGYPLVLIMSSVAVLMSGFIILTLPSVQSAGSTGEKEYFSILKAGVKEAFNQVNLLRLILFLAVATALSGALEEYWSIFADQAGLPLYGLGIFIGILSAGEALGTTLAHRFEKYPDRFFFLLFSLNGLLLLLAAFLFNVPALFLLLLFAFSFAILIVVYEGKVQHAISSDTRATISSLNGFLIEIGALIVYFSVGMLAQLSNYRNSFLIFGIIITAIGLLYWAFGKRSWFGKPE